MIQGMLAAFKVIELKLPNRSLLGSLVIVLIYHLLVNELVELGKAILYLIIKDKLPSVRCSYIKLYPQLTLKIL